MNKTKQTPSHMSNRKIFYIFAGIILASIIVIALSIALAPEPEIPDETVNSTFTTSEESTATIGQQNALTKAIVYLDSSDFSETKLRSQLEFEGFTTEEIDYAIEYVPASYNSEASDRAILYYTTQSLSKERIISQLEFEGYTESQIEYAISSLPE